MKDFTIYNEHGQIQFIGETDITEVDLFESVTISWLSVQVYNEDLEIPEGHKLNKSAMITLNDFIIPKEKTQLEFIKMLQSEA